MKHFWLFRPSADGLTRGRTWVYWLWNVCITVFAGLCLGVLSLAFAYGDYPDLLFQSYFQVPLIAVLNILPALILVLALYFLFGRAWVAFLASAAVVMGFSLANYYKLRFRDDPVIFEDLKYIREAGAITQTAKYDLTPDKRI